MFVELQPSWYEIEHHRILDSDHLKLKSINIENHNPTTYSLYFIISTLPIRRHRAGNGDRVQAAIVAVLGSDSLFRRYCFDCFYGRVGLGEFFIWKAGR